MTGALPYTVTDGRPPWVSNLSGTAVDAVAFTAPVGGVYQIEVYGYTAAWYQLDIVVGTTVADLAQRSPTRVTDTPWPEAPALSIAGEPARDFPQGHFSVYLPVARCNVSVH